MKNDYGLEGETLKDFMHLARDFHFSTNRKTQLSKQVKNGVRSIEGIREELELKRKKRKREARKMNIKPKPKSPPFLDRYVYTASLKADKLKDEIMKLKGFERDIPRETRAYFIQHFSALLDQINTIKEDMSFDRPLSDVATAKPINRETKFLSCGL